MSAFILVTDHDGVRTIRMNRPDKKNAITFDMYAAMAAALRQGDADPKLRVMVLTGTGDCFTAGNDLGDFLKAGDVASSPAADFLRVLSGVSKPVVAAINGLAIGIGVTMLLHCDMVLAVQGALLHLPFIDLALVPEGGSSLLLPRLVGLPRAAEMLMLGQPFSAEQAQAWGMVNAVHAAAALDGAVAALTTALAAKPPTALAATKALLRLPDDSVASRLGVEFAAFAHALRSPELQQAVALFLQKR